LLERERNGICVVHAIANAIATAIDVWCGGPFFSCAFSLGEIFYWLPYFLCPKQNIKNILISQKHAQLLRRCGFE